MKIIPKFDSETVQKVISTDFPDLKIESVRLIDNGWDNLVAEVNDRFIFRFPKGDVEYGPEKNFEREIKILEFLQDKITLAIPKITFIGRTFTYMGYEKIPGYDLILEILSSLNSEEREKLIFDLANFLKEIHSTVSVEQAKEFGFPEEILPSYTELVKKLFFKIKDHDSLELIKDTCDEFDSIIVKPSELVFLFNDLHNENMAFDTEKKRLNGIFDFGDLAIGDISADFYPLSCLGSYFMKAVMEKYQELTGRCLSLRRAIIYSRINKLCDLAIYIDKPESNVYKKVMAEIEVWKKEKDLFKLNS